MKNFKKINLTLLGLAFFNLSYAQPYGNYENSYNNYSSHTYQQSPYSQNYGYQNEVPGGYYTNDNYQSYSSSQPHQKYHDGNTPQPFDWNYHESWRDNRHAYYSGETQPQAYREAHPAGEKGIGYDADPVYLKMKNDYEKLQQQTNQQLAENNRIASREPGEKQEYYSRGGGGGSQKGKASREARQKSNNY